MSDIVANRQEILFLYDVKDANPNGDPLDENKPRIDEETATALVSDVRLKRTVRDYLHDFKGREIFIRGVRKEDGVLKTKEDRLTDLKIDKPEKAADLLAQCIDIRLFGATTAIKDRSIIYTGPVQFKIGRSLHRVNLQFMKGTTVMPSEKNKKQGTYTEQYLLPYALIAFSGIVNENAAKTTMLTQEDCDALLDGLWNGTKNLISRSKAGQVPRLLVNIVYKEKNYHIGDLNAGFRLATTVPDEELREIDQYELVVDDLVGILAANATKIEKVQYCADPRLRIRCADVPADLGAVLKEQKIAVETLAF